MGAPRHKRAMRGRGMGAGTPCSGAVPTATEAALPDGRPTDIVKEGEAILALPKDGQKLGGRRTVGCGDSGGDVTALGAEGRPPAEGEVVQQALEGDLRRERMSFNRCCRSS